MSKMILSVCREISIVDTVLTDSQFCVPAREQRIDVVLVDTAGRMQDNEPLMRALSKVGCLPFKLVSRP